MKKPLFCNVIISIIYKIPNSYKMLPLCGRVLYITAHTICAKKATTIFAAVFLPLIVFLGLGLSQTVSKA